MSKAGQALLGTLQLDDTHRHSALRYSSEAYYEKYLDPTKWKPPTSFPVYHQSDLSNPGGNLEQRRAFRNPRKSKRKSKFLTDMRNNSVKLSSDERS